MLTQALGPDQVFEKLSGGLRAQLLFQDRQASAARFEAAGWSGDENSNFNSNFTLKSYRRQDGDGRGSDKENVDRSLKGN